jgi:hypothetical protein
MFELVSEEWFAASDDLYMVSIGFNLFVQI